MTNMSFNEEMSWDEIETVAYHSRRIYCEDYTVLMVTFVDHFGLLQSTSFFSYRRVLSRCTKPRKQLVECCISFQEPYVARRP